MLNQLLEYLRQIITLTDKVEKNSRDCAALQKEFTDFAKSVEQKFAAVTLEFQRVHTRIDNLEKDKDRERRLIILELENRLLRTKLQLSPADDEAGG